MNACRLVLILICVQSVEAAPAADYGRSQVEQIMRDRPDIAPFVREYPELRRYLEAGFDGEGAGHRITWDNREPNCDALAKYDLTYRTIRLSNSKDMTPVWRCIVLVDVLEEARTWKQLDTLIRTAYTMSRDDFARKRVTLQLDSIRRTRDFFRKNPLPLNDQQSKLDYQVLEEVPTFDEYFQMTRGEKVDPLEKFREWHDAIVEDIHQAKNANEEAGKGDVH